MTGKQAVVGCVAGCAGVALLGLLVIAGFALWVTRTGELIEPERLFAEDTTGYVTWTLRLEDPGTAGFVASLSKTLDDLQRQQSEVVPEPLRSIVTSLNTGAGGDLRRLFPLALVWTSSRGAEGEDDLRLLSLSLASLGNRLVLIDWVLSKVLGREPDSEIHDHAGEKIYRLGVRGQSDEVVTFFVRGNDLFFVTDLATARRAIDRLSGDPPAGQRVSELDRLFALAPEGAALRGAISNEQGEIARLWRELAHVEGEEPDWGQLSGLVLGGGLSDDGAFEGVLELIGREPGWAADRSASHVDAIRRWLEESPFEIESSSETSTERVRLTLRVPDLARKLGRFERTYPLSTDR